ncbi:Asp-tRNA(Asn)/Glu-tRNA(Gln) amidotransferase subunit GatC [uncultured Ruminococcus sp.]|uniref:Asp-tRNA(Asn)/Glu-tRNA(Gln) amidotransferase subunit GatC n=1 Tax=uncultured Ruminococcus sp. TaxID=165186 RepID=UPI0025D179D3|nr:Asp-tRNA(Asn)/Glu-tRNA(Gln) amidotransferase subunit GatC [uncultured Ruminococcus sp.]
MDTNLVKYLAELGKLEFSDEELEKVSGEMTGIIDLMDTIKEIDVTYDDTKDNHNVYLNDIRKDEVAASMPTEKVLQNAVNQNNCFVVPKVVE